MIRFLAALLCIALLWMCAVRLKRIDCAMNPTTCELFK